VRGAVAIKRGYRDRLELGSLNVHRDWLHVRDSVKAHWLIINQEEPDDYVVASGETHSVGELCDLVFSKLGLDYRNFVFSSEKYVRPEELYYLKGDASKLRKLGWHPEVHFVELINEMLDKEMKRVEIPIEDEATYEP
jgi:GDPmannose 4,6-dehydratase